MTFELLERDNKLDTGIVKTGLHNTLPVKDKIITIPNDEFIELNKTM